MTGGGGVVARIVDCTLPGQPVDRRFTIELRGGRIAGIAPVAPKGSGLADRAEAGTPGEVIDAGGRALLPGFVDAHAHVVEAGIERLRCDMSGSRSAEETRERVAAYAASSDEPWLVGRGWELDHLAPESCPLELLDRLTGDRPAYLNNANGHSARANSAALRLAGLTERTPDPVGGSLGRDAGGRLDGMLHESALNLVNDIIPPLTAAQKRAGLRAGVAELLGFGVTAWQEAIVGPYVQTTDVAATLRDGAAAGEVPGRVEGALWWPRGGDASAIDEVLAQRATAAGSPRFRCDAVKIMLDGTAVSRTAAMLDPYLDAPAGETFFEPETLARVIAVADRHGLDVHVHANGDRAVRDTVDAIEAAVRDNPARVRRHQIAHLNFVRPEDALRMARLGIIAVVQPAWAHPSSKLVDQVLPAVSAEAAARTYPFGSLHRAGVELAFSSDWPVSPPDPWAALQGACRRRRADSVGTAPLLAAEAMPLDAALRAATAGSARALRLDRETGALRVGLAADLVLGDRSWHDAGESLEDVQTDLTLIDGKVVYSR